MYKKILIIAICFIFPIILPAQTETYTVTRAPFSKDNYAEFSPVYYRDGIVFCTNRKKGFSGYSNSSGEGFMNIYYVDNKGGRTRPKTKLFSKNLRSRLNDGPVTFNQAGDTIYFSRNLIIEGSMNELSSNRNKLGIFSAVMEDNKWTRIREFRFNNEWHNVTTPYLSPDGQSLYFASDMPGGFGGSDLYYSQWKDGYWDTPVNLGPVINTSGNEAYPFINSMGELFFSSDGHPGLGGRDIFVTKSMDTTWHTPVGIDPPINSKFDDFGITTDMLMNEGYFSSNRDQSVSIYHFKTNFPQIFYSNIQKENLHCFTFQDHGSIEVDTTYLQYKWHFGDGTSATGAVVKHCFLDPGNYKIRLDIIDRRTGKLFFTKLDYDLELRDYEQAYISSPEFATRRNEVKFNAQNSYLPGYSIIDYAWDFGDGNRASGLTASNVYSEEGKYTITLVLTLRSELTGQHKKTNISKHITISGNQLETEFFTAEKAAVKTDAPDIRDYENAIIKPVYSAEIKFQQDAIFAIELLSSKNKVDINNKIFRNVPPKYTVRERFIAEENTYSYIIDQRMTLMATYPAYSEILRLGFKDVRIRLFVLKDAAEKELHNLIKNHGASADLYFDRNNKLTSNAYIMLDQLVTLINKYPAIMLEIAVHTDNTGTAAANLALSQTRSRTLVNYLINRGISSDRVLATGYGGSKPVAPEVQEKDRKLNRRIDLVILK